MPRSNLNDTPGRERGWSGLQNSATLFTYTYLFLGTIRANYIYSHENPKKYRYIFWRIEESSQLELAFSTKMLRDICESEVHAHQLFDAEIAINLIARLADLRAADRISHLPSTIEMHADQGCSEYIQIELTDHVSLTICANHTNNPLNSDSDSEVDWERVSRIKICSIGEYSD